MYSVIFKADEIALFRSVGENFTALLQMMIVN
jgi:hypothetical protein